MSLVEIKDLNKTYGSKQAVHRLSFGIREGSCVALLGPNGAGKTTTLQMLAGLLAPTSGSIRFNGLPAQADLRRYIGYLPQQGAYYNWMSGSEFMHYSGQLAGLSKKEAVQRTNDLLDRVGLQEARKRKIGGYSGGMKQRLGLAQALIHQPKLVILDEPVSALDPVGRREVLELLKEIRKEATILFSTHVLHDAEAVSDDVLMIRDGELVLSGTLRDIRNAHRQPVIYIEEDVPQALQTWAIEWERLAHVTELSYQDGIVKLVVEQPDEVKQQLLQQIAQHRIPIRRFELAQTTLEDLFLKVVSS
ncbi:ABC transporter ATP-binding protein [Paenibacillus daejeonensis]|uniref:ABC transporter ATP-binding protein n=1 Tax=Paenibacillus daejeonensis TaxID=135193 RepID=UPI0003685375|nr:ABC transporter ATP-binding protein [Paenibacillus daejeonensis]